MAVLAMNKIRIYGLKEERKGVLEFLHKCETVEIDGIDAEKLGVGKQETVKSISNFNDYIASANKALNILNSISPEKTGMFSKRIKADEKSYSADKSEIERVGKYIRDILKYEKAVKENSALVSKKAVEQMQITPFLKLDVPISSKGTKTTVSKLGTFEGAREEGELINLLRDKGADDCYFEILSSGKHQTCVWFVFPKERNEEITALLRSEGFTEATFSSSGETFKERLDRLENEKNELLAQNEEMKRQIEALLTCRDEIKLFYDRLVMRKEKYEALSKLGITQNAFVISGYIPDVKTTELLKEIKEKFNVYTEVERAEGEGTPVAFSNNAFVQPVEGITGDYSMPSPDDVDPNPVMAFFYYFFFGMMFSDAGYGLLMMIVCGILGFGNVLEKSKRRAYKMFFYCGVSTTFWGIMYGSFFGDMIDTVARVFLNSDFTFKPLLLNPTQKPLELLIMSVAFGMVHILTALVINFYVTWRKGEKIDAVCDTGFWILALFGICLFAGGMVFEPVKNIGLVISAAGFTGLLLTGGRNKKNIIGKIFGGVLSLYDITSYMGDALSYSRLMALGLATGVIASVINVLGSLGGPTVIGVIAYIAISLFGHALNFAINCLGAYVHTNRLQYVEFYQKFYEGGGRKFKPLMMNTKYYNFSKEE